MYLTNNNPTQPICSSVKMSIYLVLWMRYFFFHYLIARNIRVFILVHGGALYLTSQTNYKKIKPGACVILAIGSVKLAIFAGGFDMSFNLYLKWAPNMNIEYTYTLTRAHEYQWWLIVLAAVAAYLSSTSMSFATIHRI